MDAITEISNKMSFEINEDLEAILHANPELQAAIDNIKINLSAGLANIRFIIQDKLRLGQITIDNNRRFHSSGGEIILFVLGIAKRVNTNNPLGKYSVVWGRNHPLNICKSNYLPRKTRDNTAMLGLLASLTQVGPLGFTRIKVMTTNQNLENTIANIELYNRSGYVDVNQTPLPDSDLLRMIRDKLVSSKVKLSFFSFQPPSHLNDLYRTLQETARGMMGDI